jgi:hypothetical protein
VELVVQQRNQSLARRFVPLAPGSEELGWLKVGILGHDGFSDPMSPSIPRGLARPYMRQKRPDHTLQATALVNEAYLRLIDVNRVEWRNRTHFLALAAQTMRKILIESARSRHRQKRGGEAVRVNIDDLGELPEPQERNLVALETSFGQGRPRGSAGVIKLVT